MDIQIYSNKFQSFKEIIKALTCSNKLGMIFVKGKKHLQSLMKEPKSCDYFSKKKVILKLCFIEH